MTRGKLLLAFCFLSFKLFTISNCIPNDQLNPPCVPSSCGNLHNITAPFPLASDPPGCGDQNFELSCEDNSVVLNLTEGKFIVRAINYNNYTIRVVNSDYVEGNCSSIPRYPLSPYSISGPYSLDEGVGLVQVIKCLKPVNSTAYLDANSCVKQVKDGFYRYSFVGTMDANDLRDGCNIEAMTLAQLLSHSISNFTEIHRQMALGFELLWERFNCPASRDYDNKFWYAVGDCLVYTSHFFEEEELFVRDREGVVEKSLNRV